MTNSTNLQSFYTPLTQSATKQSVSQNTTLNFEFKNLVQDNLDYQKKDYKTNMQKVCNGEYDKTQDDLFMQTYIKSQSILGKVSQNRYEQTLKSLLAKVQNFMQGIQEDSMAYDFVDRIYENVIYWADPEKVFIKNNRINFDEKELTIKLVQDSKDKLLGSLYNQSSSVNQDLEYFKEQLSNYETCLEHIMQEFVPFFAAFESEFSQSEMEQIIDDLATIRAYNDYKAHNITLVDGSTISWSRNLNGQMIIKINEFDINTALENADKVLTEMKNFNTLLEMFRQRENLSDISVNLNENSKTNLNLNNTNLNRNANTINSHLNLNEFFNTKTNSNKYSNDNLLKALLQGVMSDERVIKI